MSCILFSFSGLKGTKSLWPNFHRSLLGFYSELQTHEKGHGVKNSDCWKISALPGLQRKSFRDSGRTWLCSHVERLRSEPSLQMKQTISSSFSSCCNGWKIRSTTIRSSAFFLVKCVFVTYWAQSRHFGVRSCSLSHNLGCTCLRHNHMSLRLYQARSIRQGLVCAPYSSIWHSMTGSAFSQSLPHPAAQQALQQRPRSCLNMLLSKGHYASPISNH